MTRLLWWLGRKFLKNLGKAGDGIYRSGQPGFIRRRIMYWILKPKTRINLAYSPQTDKQDADEREFLLSKGVEVDVFTWSAGGATKPAEVLLVYQLLLTAPMPIWIGCEGGKDRTGGIIAFWKKTTGCTLEEIITDFSIHGIPAEGWLRFVFGETK